MNLYEDALQDENKPGGLHFAGAFNGGQNAYKANWITDEPLVVCVAGRESPHMQLYAANFGPIPTAVGGDDGRGGQ